MVHETQQRIELCGQLRVVQQIIHSEIHTLLRHEERLSYCRLWEMRHSQVTECMSIYPRHFPDRVWNSRGRCSSNLLEGKIFRAYIIGAYIWRVYHRRAKFPLLPSSLQRWNGTPNLFTDQRRYYAMQKFLSNISFGRLEEL